MKIKNVLSFLLAAVMTATSIPVVTASSAPAEEISVGVTGADATTFAAENTGNKYLYVKEKDWHAAEGINVSFTPVSGVKTYYISAKVRGAGNVISTGSSVSVRINSSIHGSANATINSSDSWFGGTGATWSTATSKVTVTNPAKTALFSIWVNQDDAGVLEIDDLRIYYTKSGVEKDVVLFDFEDDLLKKSGATITVSPDRSSGYNHDGNGAMEIREENVYYRANGENAIIDLDDDFEAGIYTLSGDFRMPYFQNTGSSFNYTKGTHRATVTVYSDGVKVGTLSPAMSTNFGGAGSIYPYWRTLSVEGITITSPDTKIYFAVESGITDTNTYATTYKNAVDVMGLTLTKTAEYDPDKAAAEQVDALIIAIGTVNDDSEAKITAARTAYDALGDAAKALVTMLSVLEDAEEAFELLPITKPAAAVDALIEAIGTVTEESEDKITAARAAYTALSTESKAYVTKLSVLEAAEAKLEFLTTPAPLNGVDKMGAELVGNKYLYVMNKDYGCPEGAMLEFVPVAGVTEYKITAKTRTANLYAPGVGTSIRTGALNGTCKVDSWFSTFSTMWKQAEDTIKLPGEATAFGSKIQVSFYVNSDDGNVLELDDIRVYYIDTNAQEQDVAFFDFEDDALTNNGATLTALENVNGYTQFDGPTTLEIREEQHYYRAADLSGTNAGKMTFDPALEPAVYTLSGEFRMPYFQNTGASRRYTAGIHTATVTVTNGSTEIGTFDISPYWKGQEFTFSSLTPISELKFTVTSTGITDTNNVAEAYKNAVDFMNLKVTQTRSFDGTVSASGYVTSLNTYSTDDLNTVTSEDGFLHIYGRTSGGNGFGFNLDETLNQGETYTVKFRARQPLASAHATTLSLEVTKDGVRCINKVADPNLQNENYATIPMVKDNVHYCGSYGVGIVEGWYEYIFTFTPKDGDIENPDLAFFPRYMGGLDEDYRYPDPNSSNWINAFNPFDIDWIEIFDGNGDSIYRDDFDGALDTRYIPVDGNYSGNNKNAGATKMVITEDDHITLVAKEGTPTLKLTGFDVPELVPGKYALTFDARLGYYEASLGFENSVASLDMAVTNSDTTTATKKTEINTEWSQVIYSFFVTETCKPSEIAITLSEIDGGVENLKRFDFKNFAVVSQIFEIETEDENSLMNGVNIYSVGDTVKTEVLADDGVTPDGYLHIYDRPLDKWHGAAFKIDAPLEGGERYYITFKARMSYTGTGNTVLTVSGNGVATGYNERNPGKDVAAKWAMPVVGKTPAPYFTTTQGVYLKDFWQDYTFEYAPVDDIAEPMFSLISNYYWNNDGSGPSVRWGSEQYNLNQDAIDIDDIVIYKVGDEANPIYSEDFNNGLGGTYKPAEGAAGSNVGSVLSVGSSNYDAGKAKLLHDTDVYESVVNDSAAPKLNLSGFNTFPAGRYALTVWVRRNAVYNSGIGFDEQETDTIAIIGTQSTAPENVGGEAGSEKDISRYEIGFEWTKISYAFNIDETTTSLDEIVMFLDNGDQPGRFDYRDFEFEQLEEDKLPPPAPGVVMMYLFKKQIRKLTHPDEFIREEKVDDSVFIEKNYFEGALTEEGVAKWTAPVQTLTSGKREDGSDYIAVRNIKNNYTPITFVTADRVPAGSYHFMLDLRTANIGETTQLEINIGGQSRLIRIDNSWTSLEFLLRTETTSEISISFRGGPLAFYTQDYDIANLCLNTLDRRKVEINAFDHSDFENPALATRGMSYGGLGMTFTYMTETIGEGEDATTNSFVRIADRVRNYDNLFLNTGVKMEAGETYTITYDIRLAEPEGKDTIRSQVGIPNKVTTKLRVDPDQNSDYTNANYNAFDITPEWRTVTATFVAADTGTMVIGICGGAGTDNIKSYDIDNLIIMAKVAPTIRIGDNKWEAGNFDDAATALAAWKGETNENLGWVGGKFEHRVDEDGNGYIHLSGREANYQNFTLNTGVKVSAGATYQITYRIRGAEDTRLRSAAGAASAKSYKLKVVGEGADDPASSSYHAFAVPTQWKTITTLYVAETDGVLGINFFGDTSPEYIHALDFDDFEIYEVYAG